MVKSEKKIPTDPVSNTARSNAGRSDAGRSNLYSLIQLYKIVLKYRPKKISLVSAKPIVLGGLLSLILGFKRVYFSITGLGYVFISQSFKARFIRIILSTIYKIVFSKKNCTVIFQNKDDLNLFVSKKIVSIEKTKIISGNGIDTQIFKQNRKFP